MKAWGNQSDTRMPRRGWILYDFANSLVVMGGSIFLPQWFVVDRHLPSVAFNLALIISSAALFFIAPAIGRRVDKSGDIFRWLCILTATFFGASLMLGVMCKIANLSAASDVLSYVCLALYSLVILSYQLCLVPYNALISASALGGQPSQISGSGYSLGWVGGVIGVVLADPMVRGKVLFATAARDNAVLPLGILAAALCTVSLFWMRSLSSSTQSCQASKASSLIRLVRENPSMFWFLLTFMLIADTVLTLENNITIYMEKAYALPDSTKATLFVGFLLCAALSALLKAPVRNRASGVRFLYFSICMWIVTLASLAIVESRSWFFAAFLLLGGLYGVTLNNCRVLFAGVIPTDHKATSFGVYSSFERFATLVGPLVWSLPIALMGETVLGYRVAMAALTLPMLVAFWTVKVFTTTLKSNHSDYDRH